MDSNPTTAFLATSERYLSMHDETLPRAQRLLKKEFKDAVAIGPEAPLSAPTSMREEQITLSQVFNRMLDADVTLLDDLLTEIARGSNADVIEFLAHAYACWVIRSYDLRAF